MITIFTLISLYTIFSVSRKLGMKGWELYVPFYNLYKFVEVATGNGWLCFLLLIGLIPIVGWAFDFIVLIVWGAKFACKVSKAYGEYNCQPGWVFFIGEFYMPFYVFKDAPKCDDPLNKFVTRFFTLDKAE